MRTVAGITPTILIQHCTRAATIGQRRAGWRQANARQKTGMRQEPKPTCKPRSVRGSAERCPWATIYLERVLPHASSGLPGTRMVRAAPRPCLAFLPVGFAWPRLSPGAPVRSYRAVSPSPPGRAWRHYASLWHSSVGSPRLAVSQHRALWSADFPQAGAVRPPAIARPAWARSL